MSFVQKRYFLHYVFILGRMVEPGAHSFDGVSIRKENLPCIFLVLHLNYDARDDARDDASRKWVFIIVVETFVGLVLCGELFLGLFNLLYYII